MARSKNATALFEVIHTAKKPPKSSTTVSVPTPKWWAKSKPAAPKPAVTDVPEAAGKQGSWLAAAAKRGVLPTRIPPAEPVETVTPDSTYSSHSSLGTNDAVESSINSEPETAAEPVKEVVPKQRFAERFAERFARKAAAAAVEVAPEVAPVEPVARIEIPATDPIAPSPAIETEVEAPLMTKKYKPKAVKDDTLAVDRSTKEVRFRLSYGGLISLAFILVLVITLAVLIGSRFAGQSTGESALDTSKKSVETVGTNNGLLIGATSTEPKPNPTPAPPADSDRPDVLAVPRHPAKQPPVVAPSAPKATDIPQTPLAISQTREVGATYIIVQSYDDKQIADKACEFLRKKGVNCTVIRGLGEYAPRDWFSVVNLFPFRAGDPTLTDYQRMVTAMGLAFSNKPYNQFEPKSYVWRADSDSHGQGE